MKFAVIFLSAATITAHAQPMEQCSYKDLRPDGTVSQTTEAPSEADGSNKKRFEEIQRLEDAYEYRWAGYHTFDVNCRPLDNTRPEYNLFIQTENGQVSLSHGLTENACYFTLNEIRQAPWRGCSDGCMRSVMPSDFVRGECFK